jgi:hypothetical protein
MIDEPPGDIDPRMAQACPLGRNAGDHDLKAADTNGYLWLCGCSAWQKGFCVDLGPARGGKHLVSAQQLQRLIDAGLHVPQALRDDVKRRLSGKA